MNYPVHLRARSIRAWRRDTSHRGFESVVACENGRIVGVSYGFIGGPPQWWHTHVQLGVHRASHLGSLPLAARTAQRILRDYFEVAEVHVSPSHQRRGVGRLLLHELLSGASSGHAILSTPEVSGENNAAFRLYRSFGFHDLLREFRFPGDRRSFALLARPLPLSPDANPDCPPGSSPPWVSWT